MYSVYSENPLALGPHNLVEVGPLKDASSKFSKYFDPGTIIRLFLFYTQVKYKLCA